MDPQDQPQAAPVQDDTQQTVEPTQQPQVEEPENVENAENVTEEVTETTETQEAPTVEQPTQAEATEPVQEEPEVNPYKNVSQPEPIAPITPEELVVDAEGNVDVNSLIGTFNQKIAQAQSAAVQQASLQNDLKDQYKSEWQKAESEFPELRDNAELRDMVYAVHANSVDSDKYLSPAKAAERILGLRQEGKKEGEKAATQHERVQKSAALETSNTPAPSTDPSNLRTRLDSRDSAIRKDAEVEYIEQLLNDGKL